MVKPVSLSNEAYAVLSKMKLSGESFSDVVLRLAEKKKTGDLSRFFGVWKNDDEWDNIKKILERDRKRFKLRTVKF